MISQFLVQEAPVHNASWCFCFLCRSQDPILLSTAQAPTTFYAPSCPTSSPPRGLPGEEFHLLSEPGPPLELENPQGTDLPGSGHLRPQGENWPSGQKNLASVWQHENSPKSKEADVEFVYNVSPPPTVPHEAPSPKPGPRPERALHTCLLTESRRQGCL